MKVLQVNCVYRKGSTGKITADIHEELLRQGVESVVCYGRGEKIDEPHVYKTCEELESRANNLLTRFTGVLYGGLIASTNRLISIIEQEKPDIVHLQCINGNFVNIYRLIQWLKERRIKTVVTLHAEFMHTGTCGYALDCERWKIGCGKCPQLKQEKPLFLQDGTHESWQRMKGAFSGFNTAIIVGVSQWITDKASQSPIMEGLSFTCIHNGIFLDNFQPNCMPKEDMALREKYRIPYGKHIVLHVTPSFHSSLKGGDLFQRLAERLPEEYAAVVVGTGGDLSPRITAIPFTNDQKELAGLYRMADVMVSTSRSDNYPTVCLEANCCGTPVVGFNVGGVQETIGMGMGQVVPAFDEEALYQAVLDWSRRKAEISAESIADRRAYCDRRRMAHDYLALYRQMANGER